MIKLSIIIPTLNEERYLPGLLKSIKSQNFSDYEIIVADADSQDRTKEIAQGFGCRIVKGGLPSKGRNEGAKIAKGNLLLFLDADTILPAGALNDFLKEFHKKGLDIATCGMYPFAKSRVLRIFYDICYNFPLLALGRILRFGTAFFLVKKQIHKKINGFDEDVKLLEDTVYIQKAAKVGNFSSLRSTKIFNSQRRFEKNGWIKNSLKIFLAYVYTLFLGPIKTNIFRYEYGHYDKN